jgi:hypothetical protein
MSARPYSKVWAEAGRFAGGGAARTAGAGARRSVSTAAAVVLSPIAFLHANMRAPAALFLLGAAQNTAVAQRLPNFSGVLVLMLVGRSLHSSTFWLNLSHSDTKHTLSTPKTPPTSPHTPKTTHEQPLNAPHIPQKALKLSRKVDECKPLLVGGHQLMPNTAHCLERMNTAGGGCDGGGDGDVKGGKGKGSAGGKGNEARVGEGPGTITPVGLNSAEFSWVDALPSSWAGAYTRSLFSST